MEFHEKLQELRKRRGLTQEELAEALYVSRTAISKWESGRGYPNLDSLKELSRFYSVSIDDLLSGENLLSIAEKENENNLRKLCGRFFGGADLLSILLIVLPLYPRTLEGFVSSVNLWNYTETSEANRMIYWILFSMLILCGIGKVLLTHLEIKKGQKLLTALSLIFSIFAVMFLALAREAYAGAVAFLLLMIKVFLLYR